MFAMSTYHVLNIMIFLSRYLLLKSAYDTRLAEIIFPLEPVLFTDYLGKDKERLPGIQAQLLYQKFRPF